MAKVLFINPNKWGRGVTTIWIASHAGHLKQLGHECRLFDCTFYSKWTDNENAFNTNNNQYQPTRYDELINWNDADPIVNLQAEVDRYSPDIIFSSAISSHIHGEGEYSSIQYFHELVSRLRTDAVIVAGGLQPTADLVCTAKRFPVIRNFIAGESEMVLGNMANSIQQGNRSPQLPGLARVSDDGTLGVFIKQPILENLDCLGEYDYSLFDDQLFFRPYNGDVLRAVDYELSRGCIYTCSYCVETVIQRYYGFEEASRHGALLKPKAYLRSKSAERVFAEIKQLHEDYGVQLFRCQDTNFLTIAPATLRSLAEMLDSSRLDIKLYIETRPEGINETTVHLLRRLKVDGVGMGVEAANEQYREGNLHRYADQTKIVRAFDLLRHHGIKSTAYNVIGFPHQGEDSILETIRLNIRLRPDNVTIAFYAPFMGTDLQRASAAEGLFDEYAYSIDPQLRTSSTEGEEKVKMLDFYKRHFVYLVRNGLDALSNLKAHEAAAPN